MIFVLWLITALIFFLIFVIASKLDTIIELLESVISEER